MNILDVVIILVLVLGLINGFRNGAIKSVVSLVGTIVCFVLAFYLKNPVADFFYTYLPFNPFNLFGNYVIFNIMLYEALAFLIIYILLYAILSIIIKVTGFIEKILKGTIVLGFISRILGGIIGIVESYIVLYLLLFVFNQPFIKITGIDESKLANKMLNNTPVLTSMTKDITTATNTIKDLTKTYTEQDYEKFNYDSMEILLKSNIIDVKSVKSLKDKNKLNINNIDELITKYGG